MKLHGRVLVLTEDADTIRQQLDGDDVPHSGQDFHYGVNTDAMISGQACTLGYTPEVLGPYFLENFKETVAKDDVRSGGGGRFFLEVCKEIGHENFRGVAQRTGLP